MYEDFVAIDRWTSEKLHCVWKGTVVAIATRHADATDIRFAVNGKPLWIAMPNLAWVEHKRRNGKVITDFLAAQAAGRYLKQAIESGYDNGREMYTMTVDEVLREVKAVVEEVGNTANLPSLPVVDRMLIRGIRLQTTRRAANRRRVRLGSMGSERLMGNQTANRYLTSRRQFIASAAAFPFALRALASPIASNPRWILLGTGTDKGIFRAAWNAESGELSGIEVAAATRHPSFLAMHPRLPILYAVNEVPERGWGAVQLSAGSEERSPDAVGAGEQRGQWALLRVRGCDGNGCICRELWRREFGGIWTWGRGFAAQCWPLRLP